ncbi:MAG TPA: glycoside hydrolase family 76 protein [Acidimicrobiales bacterium]|nr:glycoside hydrolase family 76 protein [Acidimicrobiales bacterium]
MTDDHATATQRALDTLAAITNCRMFDRRRHLFGRRRWLITRSYEALWPFADAWSAVVTLASLDQRPEVQAALDDFDEGLAAYAPDPSDVGDGAGPVGFESYPVPPIGRGGDRFYDDNAWIGLALVRQSQVRHDPRSLALARRVTGFVTSGWSSDPTWSRPGGIRWKEPAANSSRHTCSNGPAAELCALVFELTGDADALAWAVEIYQWVRSALLGPDGLYADRITPEGTVEPTTWTYNQGTMIGAGALLHRITGEPRYLSEATATAAAAQERYTLEALMGQDAAFNAVYFRNLLLLDAVSPDPAYRASARSYADAMWGQRDPRTGLFAGGSSPLNATAPMIEIYALVAGAEPHP